MNWKKLFESYILERGYTYYCKNAVENKTQEAPETNKVDEDLFLKARTVKTKEEVGKMAGYAGGRQVYRQIVFLLRKMKKIKGGSKMVEAMVADWKVRYKNRPAMMDELGKL